VARLNLRLKVLSIVHSGPPSVPPVLLTSSICSSFGSSILSKRSAAAS